MLSWLQLGVSIVMEVAGTTALKMSDGFSRLVPSLLVAVFYGLSFFLFALALKRIDLGVAYAIWAGLGTALVATIGIVWFGEAVPMIKLISLVLIIAGVVGLNLSGGTH